LATPHLNLCRLRSFAFCQLSADRHITRRPRIFLAASVSVNSRVIRRRYRTSDQRPGECGSRRCRARCAAVRRARFRVRYSPGTTAPTPSVLAKSCAPAHPR